jgi:NAD+ kinase
MREIGIFAKLSHPQVPRLARELAALALGAGWAVSLEEPLAAEPEGARALPAAELARRCDLAVVLGGDGTLIRVVRLLDEREVPVFGVNLGSLGFLTGFTAAEAAAHLEEALSGRMKTSERLRLQADVVRASGERRTFRVLNDVVVSRGSISRIIDIEARVDGTPVTVFRADGLIVSTPTGSTAYAMAAGGPILAPDCRALVLSPICPHMLTLRPLVVREESRIELAVRGAERDIVATFDGQQAEAVGAGDRIEIRSAPGRVRLVEPPRSHFEILRTRLRWGER